MPNTNKPKRTLKRGDVYRAQWHPPDSPQKPISKHVVVLQEGIIVRNSPTVVCVNMTTQGLNATYPWDVLVSATESKTVAGARVICSQIHTLCAKDLTDYRYSLTPETMEEIDQGLLLGIGLVKYEDIDRARKEAAATRDTDKSS